MPCGSNKFVLSAVLVYSLVFTSVIIYHHHYQHPLLFFDKRQELNLSISINDPIKKFIHFLETSDSRKSLLPLHACAIESAARYHPQSEVILHAVHLNYEENDEIMIHLLNNFPNFRVSDLNVSDVFHETPLKAWYEEGKLNESLYPVIHLSDALRLAIMYKLGGIYMDTDVITLKSMDRLSNAMGVELSGHVNNAVMVFEAFHPFVNACLGEYVRGYNGSAWGQQGPLLVTRVVRSSCNLRGEFDNSTITRCAGVNIYPEVAFYSLPFERLFSPSQIYQFHLPSSYTAHLWSSQTGNKTITPGDGTTIDTLFQLKCPSSYEIMKKRAYIQGQPKICLLFEDKTNTFSDTF